MKKLFISMLFSCSLCVYAQTPIEEVDLGSCWIQDLSSEVGHPSFKIASFGSINSGAFHMANDGFKAIENALRKFLSAQLAVVGDARFGIAVHCSAHTHQVMIPLEVAGVRYCVRGYLESGYNALKLNVVLPDPENNSFDSCDGIEKGVVLFGLKKNNDADKAIDSIKQRFNGYLADIKFDQSLSLLELRLKNSYYFKELELKNKLDSDSLLSPYRNYVDFNYLNSMSGEGRPLWTGTATLP
jgi:hypothetical protein